MGAGRARGDAPEIVEAGLRLPEPHEGWGAVPAAAQPLMVEPLRTALHPVLIPLSFFLVQDLLCFPDRTATLLPIKVFQFSLVAASLWWLRSGRTRGNVVAFALCLCAVFGLCATAAGIVRGIASGTALLFIVVTAGTAIGFPWGARAQAVLV